MIIFKKADTIRKFINNQKNSGKSIGFVPTMGALHNGHLALIKEARSKDHFVVCSIFVNPTQFNNPEDFKNYPITIEKDIELLTIAGCDTLFLPSVNEIYPPDYNKKHYNLGRLEQILEGYYRPGHFQGVCQVMDRLLSIINTSHLYLGQKDFQQCMVIKKLIELLNKDSGTSITIIPTLRETDGLAMSSRNLRLNEEQRKIAPRIFEELLSIKKNLHGISLEKLIESATDRLNNQGFRVDYIEIAESSNLEKVKSINGKLVVLAAAYLGPVRLIDNLLLN